MIQGENERYLFSEISRLVRFLIFYVFDIQIEQLYVYHYIKLLFTIYNVHIILSEMISDIKSRVQLLNK